MPAGSAALCIFVDMPAQIEGISIQSRPLAPHVSTFTLRILLKSRVYSLRLEESLPKSATFATILPSRNTLRLLISRCMYLSLCINCKPRAHSGEVAATNLQPHSPKNIDRCPHEKKANDASTSGEVAKISLSHAHSDE